MYTVGFVGLGVMGLPMAKNLIAKSKLRVLGFDVVAEKLKMFEEFGGVPADSMEQVYREADVLIQMLPTHQIIRNSIENAIRYGKPGNIVVDMSSTAPEIIQELYAKAKEQGISLLDSPVSGGDVLAQKGTLAIMVGGDYESYQQVEDILSCMGTPVYTGKSGSGSLSKLVNNMIVGASVVGLAEAYAFAEKCGLDLQLLFDATHNGFVGGPMYESKAPKIIARDFNPGARIAVHRKDIINARNYAQQLGIDLPMTEFVLKVMNWMETTGRIDEDQSALVKYFEESMDISVES